MTDPLWTEPVRRDDPHIEAIRELFEARWYGYIDIGIGDGGAHNDHDVDELRRIIRVVLDADQQVRCSPEHGPDSA